MLLKKLTVVFNLKNTGTPKVLINLESNNISSRSNQKLGLISMDPFKNLIEQNSSQKFSKKSSINSLKTIKINNLVKFSNM